ncbi:hypothetical protein MMC13_001359 [Lambiella insularis]|nr:hypothetical protein [Lambiella insularis]
MEGVQSDAHWRVEQAQALLAEEKQGIEEVEESRGHQSRKFTATQKCEVAAATFLLLILALVAVATVGTIRPAILPLGEWKAEINITSSRADYSLGLDWDLDAPSTVREYWWTIEEANLNPDGVFKQMLLINGQFPGPMIRCNDGDNIVVHVENKGTNATSIHFHGLYQNGTNWMDGTVGITQCPIAPRRSFTYEFQVKGQSGTYWYHAHQGTQLADGLYGPLIVHSKLERQSQRIQYDTDRVVMVSDHYHDLSSALLVEYLQPDQENAEPVPDGALINGRNTRNCEASADRRCDNTTTSLATFNLASNQNHRIRFINTGSFAEFQVQIDEHEFAVTEVDGTDVEPVYYHRLNINSGQRYSVILSTNVTTADSFWMRARMITDCFAAKNPSLIAEVRAVIRYDGNRGKHSENLAMEHPNSLDWPETIAQVCKDMNTTELVPAKPISAPPKADEFFHLWGNFKIGAWRLSRGFFNDSSWRSDVRSPSLERFINGYMAGNDSFTTKITGFNDMAFNADSEMVIQVDGIKTIDILVQNFDDGNHPLHLHGYKYFVLAQGRGYFPWDTYKSLDLKNPLRRDTASVEAYSWLLIRLVTDNPGLWAFHCHISWHTEAGMLMQFLTRPDIVGNWRLPAANTDLCLAEGLEKGMTPKDELWFGTDG